MLLPMTFAVLNNFHTIWNFNSANDIRLVVEWNDNEGRTDNIVHYISITTCLITCTQIKLAGSSVVPSRHYKFSEKPVKAYGLDYCMHSGLKPKTEIEELSISLVMPCQLKMVKHEVVERLCAVEMILYELG